MAESVRDKGAIPVRGPAAREPARAFELSRPGAPTVRITFLSSTAFRITVPGLDEEPANLPEYMRVKSDADYPPVAVNIDKEGDGATFATSGARVQIVPGSDRLTVDVRTPDKVLIENWEMDPGRRSASIELRADEHVFGFGDKRAALDQRGQKVEMLNRDAFASENNESYKSIPFYMSSAGYGLFFHNFYRSMFDIGAAKQDRLAELSGVSKRTISHFEAGQRGPIPANRAALARALEEAGVEFTNGDQPGVRLRKA